MEFIIGELGIGGMLGCKGKGGDLGEVFRLDAKADNKSVAIGGWRCRGYKRTKDAPWFAVSLDHECPLGVRKGGVVQDHRLPRTPWRAGGADGGRRRHIV